MYVINLHFLACTKSFFFIIQQEINISFVDNEISLALLQISMIASSIKQLQQVLDALNDSVKKHNELISHSELEITRSNARIERKQTQIDQLNKQIDQRLSKMEGVSYMYMYVHCKLMHGICILFTLLRVKTLVHWSLKSVNCRKR